MQTYSGNDSISGSFTVGTELSLAARADQLHAAIREALTLTNDLAFYPPEPAEAADAPATIAGNLAVCETDMRRLIARLQQIKSVVGGTLS